MAIVLRATRLVAVAAALTTIFGLAGTVAVSAQPFTQAATISNPSFARPEFTRPGGIPGSARSIAATNEQYLLAPAQPTNPATPKMRKKH